MAETVIALQDRGPSILTSIDLYDEGQLGAGQTIFRNRYESMDEVKQAITDVLAKSPIVEPDEEGKTKIPILSINRFKSNNVHGLRKYDLADPYPEKSRWLVHFLLRFNFGSSDFCYVDLGLNWAPLRYADGTFNPDYPLGEYTPGQTFKLEDLKILRVCMCTVDDAVKLVESFKLKDPKALEIIDPSAGISAEQLDALELSSEDARVLTMKVNGEERILTYKNQILTFTPKE